MDVFYPLAYWDTLCRVRTRNLDPFQVPVLFARKLFSTRGRALPQKLRSDAGLDTTAGVDCEEVWR